jgi:hypothetical protein
VAGNVHRQFQPTPNPNFVECATQVILDDLLAGSHNLADFAIGEALAKPKLRSGSLSG